MAARLLFRSAPNPIAISHKGKEETRLRSSFLHSISSQRGINISISISNRRQLAPLSNRNRYGVGCFVLASNTCSSPKTRLYISGLSFRTTEESLRNAFQNFGQLVEVNLVMDKIANRPRGFAFLRYATEDQSQKAIEGMHGKFLDGRVIFVEVAKPRSELRQGLKQNPRQY